MKNCSTKRFLSIRMEPADFDQVYRLLETSTCRSLTEYARKVLTNKPVTFKVRNVSIDEALPALFEIRGQLEELLARYSNGSHPHIYGELLLMKEMIHQNLSQWSR